jgi:hypothetical protein
VSSDVVRETLNGGAVDKILWMDVLCLVTWCVKRSMEVQSIEYCGWACCV